MHYFWVFFLVFFSVKVLKPSKFQFCFWPNLYSFILYKIEQGHCSIFTYAYINLVQMQINLIPLFVKLAFASAVCLIYFVSI